MKHSDTPAFPTINYSQGIPVNGHPGFTKREWMEFEIYKLLIAEKNDITPDVLARLAMELTEIFVKTKQKSKVSA